MQSLPFSSFSSQARCLGLRVFTFGAATWPSAAALPTVVSVAAVEPFPACVVVFPSAKVHASRTTIPASTSRIFYRFALGIRICFCLVDYVAPTDSLASAQHTSQKTHPVIPSPAKNPSWFRSKRDSSRKARWKTVPHSVRNESERWPVGHGNTSPPPLRYETPYGLYLSSQS